MVELFGGSAPFGAGNGGEFLKAELDVEVGGGIIG